MADETGTTGTAEAEGAGAQDGPPSLSVVAGRMALAAIAEQLVDLADAMTEPSDEKAARFFEAMADPSVVTPIVEAFVPFCVKLGMDRARLDDAIRQYRLQVELLTTAAGGGR